MKTYKFKQLTAKLDRRRKEISANFLILMLKRLGNNSDNLFDFMGTDKYEIHNYILN
jgi:hypothetical protein